MIYPDGRAFDLITDKFLPLLFEHNCQYKGPVLYWKQKSRITYLHAARLVFETFVLDDVLHPKFSVITINDDWNDIRPENLKKIIKNHLNQKKSSIDRDFSDWMGSDTIYM